VRSNIITDTYFSLHQSIIKERLYGGISISNPFKNKSNIINEMRTDSYYIKDEHQEQGRVFKFWLRFTFGRFDKKVRGVEGAYLNDVKTR
jgi:hypothetical protein